MSSEEEKEEYITDIVKDSKKLQRKLLLDYANSPFARMIKLPPYARVQKFLEAKEARNKKHVSPKKNNA